MNHSRAKKLLHSALECVKKDNYLVNYSRASAISDVIQGNHLTFRYILFTAILARATDNKVHARALQVGSDLTGAYDARSLCHDVLVPFERDFMESALGGSNEPYLNKPARYKQVDLSNAVRKGKDTQRLISIHNLLDELMTEPSSTAFDALCACVYYTRERIPPKDEFLVNKDSSASGLQQIIQFIELYSSECHGGETAATAVGSALSCLYPSLYQELSVYVHPVNQAGSSSNEVADVDGYLDEDLAYAIEVKDKNFTLSDVGHAAKKVKNYGHDLLIFIIGERGLLTGDETTESIEKNLSSDGFTVIFTDVMSFCKNCLLLVPHTDPSDFYDLLIEHCKYARIKDKTRKHLKLCASELGWI